MYISLLPQSSTTMGCSKIWRNNAQPLLATAFVQGLWTISVKSLPCPFSQYEDPWREYRPIETVATSSHTCHGSMKTDDKAQQQEETAGVPGAMYTYIKVVPLSMLTLICGRQERYEDYILGSKLKYVCHQLFQHIDPHPLNKIGLFTAECKFHLYQYQQLIEVPLASFLLFWFNSIRFIFQLSSFASLLNTKQAKIFFMCLCEFQVDIHPKLWMRVFFPNN